MTRLVINAKLAIPGLAVLAHDVYNDTYSELEAIKHIKDTIKVFSRFTKHGVASAVEEYYTTFNMSENTTKQLKATILEFVKLLRADTTANANLVELFTLCSSTIGGNTRAYYSLRDKISIIPQRDVVLLFPLEVSTQHQTESLEFLSSYSAEQINQLKAEKDSEYKDILRARKLVKHVTATFIRQYVRERGLLVSYQPLVQALNSAQLEHSLPEGFSGYIDEFCGLYTTTKRKLAITPYNCVVTMNPKYDAKLDNTYVLLAKSAEAKSYTAVYTADFKKQATDKKFQAVKALVKSIDNIRASWLNIVVHSSNAKDVEAATILELIYCTQARLGSKQNATLDKATQQYKRTFGISTILGKHIRVENDSIVIEYPGKAAFKGDIQHFQKHVILQGSIDSKIFYMLMSKAGTEGPVFTVSQQRVRDLLKECGAPEGVTVHKLRTLKGTTMMQQKISTHPFKTEKATTASVTKWLKEQALEVGTTLGHMSGEKYTSSTAIAHYIDPATMLKLYREAKVMPPKPMLKLLHIDSATIESIQ